MHRSLPLPFALSLLLVACSGGGGGGGGVSVPLNGPVTSFAAFSAITANSLVEFRSPEVDDGLGGFEPMAYNYRATYEPLIEAVDLAGTATFDPASTLVYIDGNGEAAQARLTVTFHGDEDLVTDFTTAPVLAGDEGDFLAFSNEIDGVTVERFFFHAPDEDLRALDYTSFGLWQLGLDGVEVDLGSAQWGAMTPDASMPLVGSAIYEGQLLGTWIDLLGVASHWEADSTLETNFNAGRVSLSAANSREIGTGILEPDLDLFPIWAATIVDNTFSGGTFGINADGMAAGTFSGAFYGPDAAEAGATFAIGFMNGRYFGSVGGKQAP